MDNIILGLLMLSSRTIYQLRSRIKKGLDLMYSSSTGSIQAALKKLLNDGLIEYSEIKDNGRDKKEYYITDEGKRVFNEWINSPIENISIKSPELTKVYFMGFSEPEKRFEIIEKYISVLRDKHNALELLCSEAEETVNSEKYKNADRMVQDIIFYQFSTARYGRDITGFIIEWYINMLEEMREKYE